MQRSGVVGEWSGVRVGKHLQPPIARFASEMEELRSTNDLESWAAVDFAFDFAVLLTIITLVEIKC